MVSFDGFKALDGVPIYLQILNFIKRGAVAGTILNGEELPSRRVLSALLGINPNTVQKAFKLLEDENLIESRAGAKSFMTLDDSKLEILRRELLSDLIEDSIRTWKQMGISKEEALELIEKNWGVTE